MTKATLSVAFEFGGSGEIRTRDQRIKSPLLYRLSYRPMPDHRLAQQSARLYRNEPRHEKPKRTK